MKRRELFAALGALFVAPAVGNQLKAKALVESGTGVLGEWPKGLPEVEFDPDDFVENLRSEYPLGGREYILNPSGRLTFVDRLNTRMGLPLADLANHPEDAKAIFEHIASSAYEFKSVQYSGFDQPRIILTGFSTVYGDAKVVITQSTIRYTTIKRNGQENTNDVRNQKVVGFIRALGYEIDAL